MWCSPARGPKKTRAIDGGAHMARAGPYGAGVHSDLDRRRVFVGVTSVSGVTSVPVALNVVSRK